MRKLRLGEGSDSCKVIRKVGGRVDSSSRAPHPISFKPRPKPRLPRDGSHSSSYSCPAAGCRWRGLGTRGVGSGLSSGSRLKTGFPPRDACCPPTPHSTESPWRVENKAFLGWPLQPAPHPPNACQPAWIPSSAPETSLTTSPISQASPGGGQPTPRVGRARLSRGLGCPCDEWICPEGSRRRDTPARVLRAAGRLCAASPRIVKAEGWTLHPRATTTRHRADSCARPVRVVRDAGCPGGASSRTGTLSPRVEWYCVGGSVGSQRVPDGAAGGRGRVGMCPAARPARILQRLCEQVPRLPQESDCAPTSSPAAHVDENPLEGRSRQMLRTHPPRGDRVGARRRTPGPGASASAGRLAGSATAGACAATAAGAKRENGRPPAPPGRTGAAGGRAGAPGGGRRYPDLCRGPQRPPVRGRGRRSPLRRVSRAEVRPRRLPQPRPLPVSISLFGRGWGEGEGR